MNTLSGGTADAVSASSPAAGGNSNAPRAPKGSPPTLVFLSGTLPCVLFATVILVVAIARVRLLPVPLERDEGEYAYIGQLMLQGIPPYGEAANMKLPGTHAAYALIMAVFGQTIRGIHLGFLLVNLGAIALIYWIGKELLDRNSPARTISCAGLAASASYAVLSVGAGVLGIWAHATHFVVLAALGGTLLLLRWSRSQRSATLIWSGLLYGIAFLMKQPGICFAAFGALYVAWNGWTASDPAREESPTETHGVRRRLAALGNLGLFAISAAVPFCVTCALLWRAGVFDKFWFWVITYGTRYGSMTGFYAGVLNLSVMLQLALADSWAIWLVAAGGLFTLWRTKVTRGPALFLTAFLILSIAAVSTGLYFRPHYCVLMLPAIALLAGAMVAPPATQSATMSGEALSPWRVPQPWLIAGALVVSLAGQSGVLFRFSPAQVSRAVYPGNPFVEAVAVADYIKAHSRNDARIAIMGSEPEIFFYASRHSATPYIYVYALMEPQPFAARMQEEFIDDVESAAPEYIVLVSSRFSWLMWPQSSRRVLQWFVKYRAQHYEAVGLADMFPDGASYAWDAAATRVAPRSRFWLGVYKRKKE